MFGRSKLVVKTSALLQAKPFDDVVARLRIGRRRQRDARHAGIVFRKPAELAILRPEIMSPLGDAMRLVDGKQRDLRIADRIDGSHP